MTALAPFELPHTHGILERHIANRIASSDGLGWSSVYASAQRERPFSQTFAPVPDCLLVLNRDGPCHALGRWNGNRFSEELTRGAINLIPGNSEFSINLGQPLDTLHVYIRAPVIEQVAREMGVNMTSDFHIRPRLICSDRILEAMMETVFEALGKEGSRGAVNIDYVARAIAAHLVQNYSSRCPDTDRPETVMLSGMSQNLARAIRFMEKNIDSSIRLDDIAEVVNWSASHLAREFRTQIGVPPHRYLIQLRVDKARDLLETSDLPIAEIAFECGFTHQEHLTRHFRRMCQSTPAAHRRDHKLRRQHHRAAPGERRETVPQHS